MKYPTIDLSHSKGLGLILISNSDVQYSNQVGGAACLHPSQVGHYVPLNDEVVSQEIQLIEYFIGPKWKGRCSQGIDEETAIFIDSVLSESIYTKVLRVDRNELKKSCEAWIFVKIELSNDKIGDSDFLKEIGASQGILTWMNSD